MDLVDVGEEAEIVLRVGPGLWKGTPFVRPLLQADLQRARLVAKFADPSGAVEGSEVSEKLQRFRCDRAIHGLVLSERWQFRQGRPRAFQRKGLAHHRWGDASTIDDGRATGSAPNQVRGGEGFVLGSHRFLLAWVVVRLCAVIRVLANQRTSSVPVQTYQS